MMDKKNVGALLVMEVLQRHLPGRNSELTDPVIALILAGVLWIGENPLRHGLRAVTTVTADKR